MASKPENYNLKNQMQDFWTFPDYFAYEIHMLFCDKSQKDNLIVI